MEKGRGREMGSIVPYTIFSLSMDDYNRSGGREGERGGITVNLSLVHLSRNKGGGLEGRRERAST